MGRPPKADGGQRGHRAAMRGEKAQAGKKILEPQDPAEVEVPDLPPAKDFLSSPFIDPDDPESNVITEEIDWSPVVKAWWKDIWTSPMAQEFTLPADLHGLYLGCYYLERSIDPHLKVSEQNAMSKSFENVQKQYGLTPAARNTLKWQVAQGESAQKRTDSLRKEQKTPQKKKQDHRSEVIDLYSRNSSTGTY